MATAAAPPRRIHAGERGIYYRLVVQRGRTVRQYEISYKDRHGQRRWESLPLGQGVTAARALRAKRQTDGGPENAPARDTFADVAASYEKTKRHLARSTRETYNSHIVNHLNPLFGKRAIATIDADDVAGLVAGLRDDYADWTVRGIWTVLQGIFKHAVRRRIIPENPCSVLSREERPGAGASSLRYLADEQEIERLLAAADDPLWRLLFLTATFTGLRLGELLGLRWEDVDTKNGFLHVRTQITSKGTRETPKTARAVRDVVLTAFLARALRAYRLVTPNATEKRPVFVNSVGHTPDRTTMRRALHRAHEAAGLERLRFHDLRHTYASILIGRGKDVVYVSRQLGHAKPSTTLDTYAKLFDQAKHADDLRAELDAAYGGLG